MFGSSTHQDGPINLSKGAKINLSKETTLHKVMVGLGWDCQRYDGSADFDLDASVFMVNSMEEQHPKGLFSITILDILMIVWFIRGMIRLEVAVVMMSRFSSTLIRYLKIFKR